MAHLQFDFAFNGKPLLCAIVSVTVSQLKLSLSDTCQMTVKSHVLRLLPVPETGIHLRNTVLASFFPSIYSPLA